MSPSLFSPTLTASTNNDDIDMSIPLNLSQNKDMDNFESLFNFDEFESSGETSSHSHSPTTASPNYTPSPPSLPIEEPITFNPDTFDFLGTDANMDFPLDFSFGNEMKSAPVVQEETFKVKQEPVEFTFGDISNSQSPVTQARPMPIPQTLLQPQPLLQQENTVNPDNFAGLPVDQQAALQQLMTNLLNYQQAYGLDIPAPSNATPAVTPSTIQPSMIFASNSPAPVSAPAPAQAQSISIQQSPIKQSTTSSTTPIDADEALRSVEPHEMASAGPSRSTRQESVASSGYDDLDSKIDRLVPLNTIFSAGKGKGGKKGGGMSSVVRNEDEELDDDESWRPSPEEYKKLSSKEKRQLRNKLSARAFRTRRKDYIGTLESHIQDRDSVIDEMRTELVSFRSENQDLRRELAALKASTMSVLHPETANKSSISPAMINALAMSPALVSPSINATAGPGPNTIRRTPTPLNTFNPRKDIPASYKGSWGGNDNMFGGGPTICHTMFTPDLVLPSTTPQNPTSSMPAPLRSLADLPRVNLNPHLNDDAPAPRPHMLNGPGNGQDTSKTFSSWSEETPFSLRSMDSYRMQMWSRLAREAAADKANLTGDVRPKFFVEVKEEPISSPASAATAAAAALAANAANVTTQHITTKLANSFLSAFQVNGTKIDSDKLAAVVTGQAKLKVVSNDSENFTSSSSSSSISNIENNEDCLSMLMGGLKLQAGPGLRTSPGVGLGARENPLGTLCGFLRHASAMPTRA